MSCFRSLEKWVSQKAALHFSLASTSMLMELKDKGTSISSLCIDELHLTSRCRPEAHTPTTRWKQAMTSATMLHDFGIDARGLNAQLHHTSMVIPASNRKYTSGTRYAFEVCQPSPNLH